MKTVFILFGLILLLSLGLFAGSIDSDGFDDLGLIAKIKDVPDSDNGYVELAYTQVEDFRGFDEDDVEESIRHHVYQKVWDEKFVTDELARSAEHIDRAIASMESSYPYFKFPLNNDITKLPSYQHVVTIGRLLILRSMYDAKNGNLNKAIDYARHAVGFSQRIKTESNTWLISHMIGLAMQYESLSWLNDLVVNYQFDDAQYKNILKIFDDIPSYDNDTFPQVFVGEFLFAKNMVDMIIDRPFHERWRDYWNSQDWWNEELNDEMGVETPSAKERVFYLLQVFFPKYYTHKNSLLNESAKYYSMLSQQALGYCNSIGLPKNENVGVRWMDLVKPNSTTDYWVSNSSVFEEYYIRRCLGHFQIESIKTIVAIVSYKNNNNKIPGKLNELVPEYLVSVPVDPFDGKDLKYSSDQGLVYSVGKNGVDDGGSHESYFIKQCAHDDLCVNNPTFPLFSVLPFDDGDLPEQPGCENVEE